jgi:hypothetical protein
MRDVTTETYDLHISILRSGVYPLCVSHVVSYKHIQEHKHKHNHIYLYSYDPLSHSLEMQSIHISIWSGHATSASL